MDSRHDGINASNVTTETYESAGKIGLRPLRIVCLEPGAGQANHRRDHAIVFSYFLPRVGDRVEREDGEICLVVSVCHKLARLPDSEIVSCMPIVFAEPIERTPKVTQHEARSAR